MKANDQNAMHFSTPSLLSAASLAQTAAAGLALLLLGGCFAPDEAPAPKPESAARAETALARQLPAVRKAAMPENAAWWERCGDEKLKKLINDALQGSPSLAAARERVEAAAGEYETVAGGTGPHIDATGNFDRNKASKNALLSPPFIPEYYGDNAVAVQLRYDLDLWGRQDARARQALGGLEARRHAYAMARLSLSLLIADAYYRYAVANETLALLEQIDADAAARCRLIEARRSAGLDSAVADRDARSAREAVRREIATEQARRAAARRALCDATGMYPDAVLPYLPGTLKHAIGNEALPAVSLDALGQRPDIREKIALVRSSNAGVKAAKAAFYPDISLTALAGVASMGLDRLFRTDSSEGSVGAAFSLPIFNAGTLEGEYKTADHTYAAAVDDYNDALLRAANETLWAIRNLRALTRAGARLQRQLDEEAAAYALIRSRRQAGVDSDLPVLQAHERYLRTETEAAALALAQRQGHLSLIRAVGGRL